MTTRYWAGGTGDWYSAALWTTSLDATGTPGPGDIAFVNGGTVTVSGTEEAANGFPLDAVQVTLGSTSALNPAVIAATDATFGENFVIASQGSAAYAGLDTTGPTGFSGTILASAAGGMFSIGATEADGTQAAAFVLLHDGLIDVSGGDNLVLTSSMVADTNVTIAAGSTFTNNGLDRVFGGTTYIDPGATLTGTGTFEAGPGGTLKFESAVPATQTITFGEAGRLDLSAPASFAGTITSFVMGDTIDLLNTVANFASYDASTGLLTIENANATVAVLSMQGPASDSLLNTGTDGAGGTLITYPGSASRTSYEIDTGAQAIGANVVNQTMTSAAGAPIIGTGITIGIMSDSFNATLNGVVDPADTAASLGYLPETAGGTSAVDVLQDSTIAGVENEGLAMAELVHRIAPGAAIDFYTAEGGQASFAQGVNALVQAGANVIVDDWSFSDMPFYQLAGTVDTAIENAISAGVDYFTAASNFGDAYYESAWQPTSASLVVAGGQPAEPVTAQEFSNGTALQTISVPSSIATTIELQWDAPWTTSQVTPDAPIEIALYSTSGSLVATSSQVFAGSGYDYVPEIALTIPVASTATQYEVAIYQTGTTSVSSFKYILFGTPGTVVTSGASLDNGSSVSAQDPGGTIYDPAAGQGSGDVHGQELIPGVNTVGASYWSTSPAFGVAPDWTEYFSSVGPGELLYDQNGNAIASPGSDGKVDFVAPDGIQTSVPAFEPFYGSSAAAPDAAAVAALMLQADPGLSTAQVTSFLEQSAVSMGLPSANQGAGLIQATTAVQLALAAASAACFMRGTRIATDRGAIAVQALRRGDMVRAVLSGTCMPVAWLGRRRVDCARHPKPSRVWPVRISAGAFGDGLPLCDLWLSPDHAVFVDDVLIPIRHLSNGTSIAQVPMDEVTYYHVELPRHDVLLAEGLPAESYLDTGDRSSFDNGGGPVALHPDFSMRVWEAEGCAPLIVTGPQLAAVRQRLNDRADHLIQAVMGELLTRHPLSLRGA